jgi:hypothetical protein
VPLANKCTVTEFFTEFSGSAAAEKLELIVRHHVFEMRFGEAAIAVLRRDIGRFAALPPSLRLCGFA